MKIYYTDAQLPEIESHKYLAMTLQLGEWVEIAGCRVMLKRIRGSAAGIVVSAPEEVLVKREKLNQD